MCNVGLTQAARDRIAVKLVTKSRVITRQAADITEYDDSSWPAEALPHGVESLSLECERIAAEFNLAAQRVFP